MPTPCAVALKRELSKPLSESSQDSEVTLCNVPNLISATTLEDSEPADCIFHNTLDCTFDPVIHTAVERCKDGLQTLPSLAEVSACRNCPEDCTRGLCVRLVPWSGTPPVLRAISDVGIRWDCTE